MKTIPALVFIATVATVAGCATSSSSAPPQDWNVRLEGWWDEGVGSSGRCGDERNLHRLSLSKDKKFLIYRHMRPRRIIGNREVVVFHYEVLEIRDNRLVLLYPFETRTDASGRPLVWEMVFVTPNRYRWRATTYSPGSYAPLTGMRCKPT